MWFFYDSTGTRIGLVSNDTVYYYLYNLQGDVIALARASTGEIAARYSYDAWGNCTVTNASGYTVGTKNPFRYRGYYYDTETGLYYLNSRYYSPEFGRFISADIFVSTGQGLTGSNMFAYCSNNPVMGYDPSGYIPFRSNIVMMADSGGHGSKPVPNRRDVTEEVDDALLEYVRLGNSFSRSPHILNPTSRAIHQAEKYYVFYELVDHEKPWDIKLSDSWEKTIGTPFPGDGTEIIYHGISLTPEDMGNYTYGVLGREFGIPLSVLLAGSYYAAHFPISTDALGNEIGDWRYIEQGFYAGYRRIN